MLAGSGVTFVASRHIDMLSFERVAQSTRRGVFTMAEHGWQYMIQVFTEMELQRELDDLGERAGS